MAPRRRTLAERRKTVGHTQEQLAHLLGVERTTVGRWEAGATDPLPWFRPKLARVLAISVDELHDLLVKDETTEAERPGARRRAGELLSVDAADESLDEIVAVLTRHLAELFSELGDEQFSLAVICDFDGLTIIRSALTLGPIAGELG